MPAILYVCPSNAARAPLAQAITLELSMTVDAHAAGVRPTHVRPQVREVLRELGMRSEGLRARSLFDVPMEDVDIVVTLSSDVVLPPLPARIRTVAWNLPDPASAPPEESLDAYRATRDELTRRIKALLLTLSGD